MTDLIIHQKRILVTGGHGFLGKHICHALRQGGAHQLIVPHRHEYDLTVASDIDLLFAKTAPEILIHAAAVVGGIGANQAEPGRFFYENALMGIQLIEAARHHAVEKVVILGTVCSYPKFTRTPFSEDDFWDGYPEETNAPYGIAKKALLTQCQAYRQQYGMNAIYVVPVNLYGPGDHFDLERSHVIPALIRKCEEARVSGAGSITLWGDGSATREFLHASDAARGILLATRHYNRPEPVNLGSGSEISIRDLAHLIAALTGFTGEIVWDASKPNGQPRRVLDCRRAEQEFGFRASIPFGPGLVETIRWYRDRVMSTMVA